MHIAEVKIQDSSSHETDIAHNKLLIRVTSRFVIRFAAVFLSNSSQAEIGNQKSINNIHDSTSKACEEEKPSNLDTVKTPTPVYNEVQKAVCHVYSNHGGHCDFVIICKADLGNRGEGK